MTCAGRSSASPTPSPAGCGPHGIGARTLTLKVRDGGFVTITRATTLAGAVDTAEAVVARRRAVARAGRPGRRRPPARRVGVQVRRAGRATALRRPGIRRRPRQSAPPAPRRPLARRQPGDRRRAGSASAPPPSGRRAAWRSAQTAADGSASSDPGRSNGARTMTARAPRPIRPRALRIAPKHGMMRTDAALRARTAHPAPDRAAARAGPDVRDARLPGVSDQAGAPRARPARGRSS